MTTLSPMLNAYANFVVAGGGGEKEDVLDESPSKKHHCPPSSQRAISVTGDGSLDANKSDDKKKISAPLPKIHFYIEQDDRTTTNE